MKALMTGALVFIMGATAAIAAPRVLDPNWPCQQVKVPSLSIALFWTGTVLDLTASKWQQNKSASALVAIVTQRRLPLEQVTQKIDDFAKTQATKTDFLDVLSGTFTVLDRERSNVLEGLDRFGQRQKTLADNLRNDGEALHAAQATTPQDEVAIRSLTERLLWNQQVFQARRDSLRYACDIPSIIEQRLYGVAKVIEKHME